MPEGKYRTAWREFYTRLGAGENGDELRKEIYYKYGGMPRKQCGLIENALERVKLDELHRILLEFEEKQLVSV